ncbi:hypothetical protein DRP05_11785 [Archaeoglobales archaeon]|nr:MAG: hypothetical protein DRP05_11785 [Archaeoglobales archaeon]
MKLRGKHSKIFLKDEVLVKKFNPQLAYNFWKEAYFLSLLQPFQFVPKVYSIKPQKLEIEMEFLNGEYLFNWFKLAKKEKKEEALKVLIRCLEKCYLLDKLGIRKEEMTHPDRHIIIVNAKPYFVDFERAHFVGLNRNAGNLTQFVMYFAKIDQSKSKINIQTHLIDVLREYKQNANEENFRRVLEALGLGFG